MHGRYSEMVYLLHCHLWVANVKLLLRRQKIAIKCTDCTLITHFGGKIGQYLDLKLDDGTVINCILGDVKADKDTDLNNIVTTHNGCCSEFIVDPKVIPDNVKITGNMSNLYDNWSSPVHSVIVYDRYTEIPTETQWTKGRGAKAVKSATVWVRLIIVHS